MNKIVWLRAKIIKFLAFGSPIVMNCKINGTLEVQGESCYFSDITVSNADIGIKICSKEPLIEEGK